RIAWLRWRTAAAAGWILGQHCRAPSVVAPPGVARIEARPVRVHGGPGASTMDTARLERAAEAGGARSDRTHRPSPAPSKTEPTSAPKLGSGLTWQGAGIQRGIRITGISPLKGDTA